jgi:hypothetical protein
LKNPSVKAYFFLILNSKSHTPECQLISKIKFPGIQNKCVISLAGGSFSFGNLVSYRLKMLGDSKLELGIFEQSMNDSRLVSRRPIRGRLIRRVRIVHRELYFIST